VAYNQRRKCLKGEGGEDVAHSFNCAPAFVGCASCCLVSVSGNEYDDALFSCRFMVPFFCYRFSAPISLTCVTDITHKATK